jgi:hypothetical protein
MLYVTIGDARRPSEAARPGSLVAKLLRYTPEGEIPTNNPYPGSPVYASGLRNSQGLAWSPETGLRVAGRRRYVGGRPLRATARGVEPRDRPVRNCIL